MFKSGSLITPLRSLEKKRNRSVGNHSARNYSAVGQCLHHFGTADFEDLLKSVIMRHVAEALVLTISPGTYACTVHFQIAATARPKLFDCPKTFVAAMSDFFRKSESRRGFSESGTRRCMQ